MAKRYLNVNIPDYAAGRGVSFLQAGVLYQDTPEAVTGAGGETTQPWVTVFVQAQATGGADLTLTDFGQLRVEAGFESGPSVNLIDPRADSNPTGVSPLAEVTIPHATQKWLMLHADGDLKDFAEGTPSVAVNPATSTFANVRERLALDKTRVANAIRLFWTATDNEDDE